MCGGCLQEHQELVVEEVLSGTQLPEFKIIKIVSHSDTLLVSGCWTPSSQSGGTVN